MSNNIVDEAIKRICSEIIVTSSGSIRIEGFKDDILTDEENVILAELNKDKEFNFQKLQEKARFYYWFERDLFSLVFPLVFYAKLKKENNMTYKRLKELIVEDLKRIKKQKSKEYDVYFPINIKTETKIRKFRINDIEVDFTNNKSIISEILKNEKVKQEFLINKNFSFSKVILCKVSLKARNHNYAIKKADEIYTFLLGIIGFYETYWKSPRTLIGIPKPISKLNQSYIFVFENKKYNTFLYYKTKEEKLQIVKLKKDYVKAINNTIRKVVKSKQRELLFKLFTAYFRGLTDRNVDYSFLSFWRVMELGILKEPSQKHQEIIEILKSLIIELKYRIKYKIERFYQLRNDFVHEGIADINEYDRNGMKSFARMIIDLYLNILYKYNTEEIKLFYYYIKRKNNIEQHLKMAEKVESLIKKD